MGFSIDFVNKESFVTLEKDWKVLERGDDMTVFQSFDWNKMLVDVYLPDDTHNYESCFAIVRNSMRIVLIAPLWIVKRNFRLLNKKGIYLIGREGWSDYLNCIYESFDKDAFAFLISQVSCRYKIQHICFENIKETTQLFYFIKNNYSDVIIERGPCVSLDLPRTIEDYSKMLSKNSRQNIRTANNRLTKDKKSIEYRFNDRLVDKVRCSEIRENKLTKQYNSVSSIRKYKYRLMNKFRFHFKSYFPLYDYPQGQVMSAYIDGKLCAYFNYAIDENKKSVIVMAAGTDLQYARYSPGILLMYNFVKTSIEEGNLRLVDFTRGDEQYKFALGGILNNNYNLSFCTNI